MSARRRWVLPAGLSALALLLAGCAGAPDPAPAPEGVGPQLSAVSVYGRHAAVRARVDVRLANGGYRAVDVESLQVEHPMFATVPPLQRRSTLPPDGRARIVPVPFGAPRCDVDDATGARVVVGVRTSGGVRDVVVPLDDGEPGLVRAHRLACAVERVAAVVDVELSGWSLTPDGDAAGSLVLRRRAEGDVAVSAIGSSILFTPETAEGRLAVLAGGVDLTTAPVRLRASRCDPHALTESKRSFTFPVFVALDGDEPVRVEVDVAGRDRGVLQDLLDRTCGPAG